MKYYIATSSLNLENILSTESISPFPFYEHRSFGYQQFYQIDKLKNFDCLLLLSQIPTFEIQDNKRDNHPMVIEINDDQHLDIVSINQKNECEIYAYNKTIHLTPANVRFIFFTDKDRILALQNCLDSKMCKMLDYFQLRTEDPSKIKLSDITKSIRSSKFPTIKITDEDNQYDRVKGFIYGYYLGLSKSISPEIAKMLAIQKRIYDIVSSINSNEGQSTKALDNELFSLDGEYTQYDPTIKISKELWEKYITRFNLDIYNLDRFLKDCGKGAEIKIDFCKRNGIILRHNLQDFLPYNLTEYNEELSSHIRNLLFLEREKNQSKIDITSLLDINPDYSLAMLSNDETDKEASLFNKILAKIIWNDKIIKLDDLRINRFDIATNITVAIKSIVTESNKVWEESIEQKYLHHLRQNIKDFSPFDITEVDNKVLQSLAAFLLKGEDFDALINYIETSAISTYQYALALWGATLGYVQIPRSIISSSLSKDSLEKIYKNSCRLMHTLGSNDSSLTLKYNKYKINITGKIKDNKINTNIISNSIITEKWKTEILSYAKTIKGKNFDTRIESLEKVLEIVSSSIPDYNKIWNKLRISSSKWITPKGNDSQYLTKMINKFSSNSLFDNDFPSLPDPLCKINSLKEITADTAIRERLIENWNYTNTKKKNDKNEAIIYFINLCNKEGRGELKSKILMNVFTEEIANSVKKEFKELGYEIR